MLLPGLNVKKLIIDASVAEKLKDVCGLLRKMRENLRKLKAHKLKRKGNNG